MMRKICTAVLRQNKILLRISEESGALLEERGGSYNSPGAAVLFIKSVLAKYGAQVRDLILAIDEPAEYYRLVSEQERTKEQLRALWDVPEQLAVLNFSSGGQQIYYGLSYAKELADKYIHILKKFPNLNGSIVPLDFLYCQTLTPGFYLQRRDDRLTLKIFDGGGAYFYKILRAPRGQQALDKMLERLAMYVLREKILSSVPENISAEYPLGDFLDKAARLSPDSLLYTRGHYTSQKNSVKLTVWQKSLLFILLALTGCFCLAALWQGYRINSLSRQIRNYTGQYRQIARRAEELQYVETDAKDLRGRSRTDSAVVRLILQQALSRQITIKEIFYEQDKKLFYIIGLDRAGGYNLLLSDLRNSNLFSALNPIYLLPLDDTAVEFKLLLTVK